MTGTDEDWSSVFTPLRQGGRGLPGGSSIAKLLAEYRGVRNFMDLPPHTVEQILVWADAHKKKTGDWPKGRHTQKESRGLAKCEIRTCEGNERNVGRG